jgi:hypothetical protein
MSFHYAAFNYLLKNGVDDETFGVFATVLDMTLKKEVHLLIGFGYIV